MKHLEHNELIGKPYGMINGRRVYRVKRGHFQVQHGACPALTQFDGTKREVEKATSGKIIRF